MLQEYENYYQTDNILVMWGDDWAHKDARKTYGAAENTIKVLRQLQDEGKYNKAYDFKFSSMGAYFDDVWAESKARNLSYRVYHGDLYSYAIGPGEMWTGFMSSLPDFKRAATAFTDFAEAVEQVSGLAADASEKQHMGSIMQEQKSLIETDNIMQHHDAITGTHSQ